MSIPPRFEWQRPERRRRGYSRWLATAIAILVAFGLGVALGEALHDNPRGTGSVTLVRTLPTSP